MYSMPPQSTPLAPVPDHTSTIKLVWENLRRLNPELPEKFALTFDHRQQLADSGVAPIDAAYAGIFSADADLALELTGYHQSGLLFGYFDPAGRLYKWVNDKGEIKPFFRLRPDNSSGKTKYLSPRNSPVFVYVPRAGKFPWVKAGEQTIKTGQNIVITEGEKKALAATLNGIPCLGLGGVNSFKTGIKGKAGEVRDLGFFIDDLYLLSQRSVIVCYDSDVAQKPEVADAIKSFVYTVVEAYKEREAQTSPNIIKTLRLNDILKYSLLPVIPGEKIGLDDAIVRWGADPVKELLANAMPLVKIARAKNDPKDITIKPLFTTEPRGDKAPDKDDLHLQNHNRSLISWLYCRDRVMTVPGLGYFKYNNEAGVWAELAKDQWYKLPEQVADAQGWRNRNSALQNQALKLVENRLEVGTSQLNDSRCLAFLNGVLNLEDKSLHPHSPSLAMTRRLGFNYDPFANCPRFLNWLFFIFAEKLPDGTYDPDSEKCADTIEFVQALLRFVLTPKQADEPYPVELFVYILGRPRKGKGTFIEIIKGLAGEAYTAWDLQSIGSETGRYSLVGKLVAICTELKGVASADAIAAINQAATNEPLRVKGLYKDPTALRLNTVLVAAGNEPIASAGTDRGGFERRAAYVKIDRDIEVQDPLLKQKLKQELPGIYNWVMQITFDEAVEKIAQYREGDQNLEVQKEMLDGHSVYGWMVDRDDSDINLYCLPGERVKFKDAYGRYKSWCSVYSCNPLRPKAWKKELIKGGTEIIESNYVYIVAPAKDKVNANNMLGL